VFFFFLKLYNRVFQQAESLFGVEAWVRVANWKIVRQGKQKRCTPEIKHPLENLVGIFLPFNPEREESVMKKKSELIHKP
jgi:hypothetical protein